MLVGFAERVGTKMREIMADPEAGEAARAFLHLFTSALLGMLVAVIFLPFYYGGPMRYGLMSLFFTVVAWLLTRPLWRKKA